MNECPKGSNLVLECHQPNGVVLLAIGYKYNLRRVCALLQPRMQEQPNYEIPIYDAKFPDQYGNIKV
jgi:hypothetical protein